jgi:glucokinase
MYIGIDIGGTKIAGGLVMESGMVLTRAQCPTPTAEGGAQILADAVALAQSLVPYEGVQGIGIGTGGQVDATRGVIVSATDLLPGWAGTDVKATFEHALNVPAAVDNDVNALAVGEARFGAAHGAATVVFLALGTGVGGALLLDGRLHHGAHWSGGEFGHVGTLEAYASGHGLVQTWRELTRDTRPDVTGHDIAAEATLDPDGPAAEAIARTGVSLGYGLVSLANALDPDLIVIGGGLAILGEALIGPARHVLQTRALPGPAPCPLIGAATLAMPAV